MSVSKNGNTEFTFSNLNEVQNGMLKDKYHAVIVVKTDPTKT